MPRSLGEDNRTKTMSKSRTADSLVDDDTSASKDISIQISVDPCYPFTGMVDVWLFLSMVNAIFSLGSRRPNQAHGQA